MAQMSSVATEQKKAASHKEWTSAKKRVVKFLRDAENEDELAMQPGEMIALINCSEQEFEKDRDSLPDWCFGQKESGSSGYFYLPFTEEATEESAQTVYTNPSNTSVSYSKNPPSKCDTSQLHRVVFKEISYYSAKKTADNLECIICKNLADNPHQTDCCGHSMCYNCGTKWQQIRNSCPQCRNSPFNIVKDARTKRLIAGLTIHCKYYTKGCAWKGGLNELRGHLESDCGFETTAACLQSGCSMKLVRQDLQVHNGTKRLIPCPRGCDLFSDDHTYDEVVTEHYKECPDWPMRCPNKCPQDNLTRASLQAHLDEDCPEQLTSCQFSETGCRVRVKRREMEEHLQNAAMRQQHISDIMPGDYIKLKEELAQCKEDNHILAEELTQCKKELAAASEELRVVEQHMGNLEEKYQRARITAKEYQFSFYQKAYN